MKAKKERPFGTTSGLERLVYALGDLGSNFVWTFCSSFLTLYYTDSVLVSAGRLQHHRGPSQVFGPDHLQLQGEDPQFGPGAAGGVRRTDPENRLIRD